MSQVYNEYSKARIGWFLRVDRLAGRGGGRLRRCRCSGRCSQQAWASAAVLLLVCAAVTVVTVVPVRGRSAVGLDRGHHRVRGRRPGRLDPATAPGPAAGRSTT